MFIDPASISSGWAYYKGRKLVKSGTIATDKKRHFWVRMFHIWLAYKHANFGGYFDSVHFEALPRRCHKYSRWSVPIIGFALFNITTDIDDDIYIKSYQKYTGYKKGTEVDWVGKYESEDEWAAICMGKWYVENKI